MRQYLSRTMAITLCVGLIVGCGATVTEEPEQQPADEAEAIEDAVVELVDVAAGGSEYDPPVAVEQIPEGAFYCPMETVHYASLEAGTCPACGMELVEKATSAEEEVPDDSTAQQKVQEGYEIADE